MDNLFKDDVEYSLSDVVRILDKQNVEVTLFNNVYGWSTYFTTKPTFATPTGRLYKDGFPAKVTIDSFGNITPKRYIVK